MQERTTQGDGREGLLKLLFGRICCVVGLLLSAGGFAVAILGASVNLSAGAVGIGLGRLGLLPWREAPRGGECRPWHCRGLLHGGRKHRSDPRCNAPGPRIRLIHRLRIYLKPAMLTRVCGNTILHIVGHSTTVYRKAISLCLAFPLSGKESAIGDTDKAVIECV
jgi:hypothetical protein